MNAKSSNSITILIEFFFFLEIEKNLTSIIMKITIRSNDFI